MTMEEQDRRILAALQENGKISNQELADKVSMSVSACWRRVRALEEAGIICGYAALVDPSAVGLAFHAVVHVQLSRHDPGYLEQFIEEIAQRREVLDCFATTGEADYHLRVRCKNLDSYNAFLDGFLFGLPGVANVRTNLILKEIKHSTVIPL